MNPPMKYDRDNGQQATDCGLVLMSVRHGEIVLQMPRRYVIAASHAGTIAVVYCLMENNDLGNVLCGRVAPLMFGWKTIEGRTCNSVCEKLEYVGRVIRHENNHLREIIYRFSKRT